MACEETVTLCYCRSFGIKKYLKTIRFCKVYDLAANSVFSLWLYSFGYISPQSWSFFHTWT